jgi:ribosomal protein S18 acetylase RimI-like enzyme
MEIKIIKTHKKNYLDLLLLADEQEDMINKYLHRGTLFVLYDDDDDLKSVCVVTHEGNGNFEIQNLATYKQFQQNGHGRHLLNHVTDYYKDKGATILVGTGDVPWIVSFYKSCGFIFSHRIKNYFTKHYDKPMFENGIKLTDKI